MEPCFPPWLEWSFSSFAINIKFSNPCNSSIFSFPLLFHHTDHSTLLLPATHSFSTAPSPQSVFSSPLTCHPPLFAQSAPCLLFHPPFLFCLSPRPFPLQPYHLTLMRVLIIYTEEERAHTQRHEILCLQKEERERNTLLVCTPENQKYTIISLHPVYD